MHEVSNIFTKEKTISSLEVAEMMETEHKEILKKLEGSTKPDGTIKQIGIIPTLTKGNFPLSDYFILSSYKDSSGKENKCYNITKLGCDFLANKFTGEKGILFTAKYVKRFHDMEEQLKPKSSAEMLLIYAQQFYEQEQRLHDVTKTQDPRFGTVNMYHADILKDIFG